MIKFIKWIINSRRTVSLDAIEKELLQLCEAQRC
jgi:hypothetical protein